MNGQKWAETEWFTGWQPVLRREMQGESVRNIGGMRSSRLDRGDHLVDDVLVFNPAKPDLAADFQVPLGSGFTSRRPLGD